MSLDEGGVKKERKVGISLKKSLHSRIPSIRASMTVREKGQDPWFSTLW